MRRWTLTAALFAAPYWLYAGAGLARGAAGGDVGHAALPRHPEEPVAPGHARRRASPHDPARLRRRRAELPGSSMPTRRSGTGGSRPGRDGGGLAANLQAKQVRSDRCEIGRHDARPVRAPDLARGRLPDATPVREQAALVARGTHVYQASDARSDGRRRPTCSSKPAPRPVTALLDPVGGWACRGRRPSRSLPALRSRTSSRRWCVQSSRRWRRCSARPGSPRRSRLLAGAYFLSFRAVAAGAALDRHGARRVLVACLGVTVDRCGLFALATSFAGLIARVLIGMGVACLMAPRPSSAAASRRTRRCAAHRGC